MASRFLLALLALSLSAPAAASDLLTKILVDRDGVVRVSERQLAEAGRAVGEAELPRLRLTVRGREVPLLVRRLPAGSPEGKFALEFLGAFPRGTKTWEDEYTTTNVYVLTAAAPQDPPPARVREQPAPRASASGAASRSPFTAHFEVNRKLIRFSGDKVPDESWFWHEVKATDAEPTRVPISVDAAAGAPFTLRVRMVGYSHMPQNPDHTVEVRWNGKVAGKAVWDGESATTFEATLDGALLKEGENVLALHATGEKTDGVDLVLLDWVEVAYQRRNELGKGGQALVEVAPGRAAALSGAGSGEIEAWSADGAQVLRVTSRNGAATLAAGAGRWRAVRAGGAFPPHQVLVSRPADLKAAGQGADFVVITHERFARAADRLAEARRKEGLATVVVPIDDVYDRFSDGLLRPDAIRDFLKYAWEKWTPRPRYVLLVGDASWDYKNASVSDEDYADWHWSPEWARAVPKNGSTQYQGEAQKNDRLFIPTHQYQSPWGHAADDNWFAVITDEKSGRPDLAIGRLTVATATEADDVVTKILEYGRLPDGAMRSALFITNDEEGFQRQTDLLADAAGKEGYEVVKVYPKKEEKDNAENTKTLIRDFDSGPAIVLFNGHGGRYIWRTGPPDLVKNHDLFTLDHLDQLADTKDLPVVVSLTCYSAPFDHPVADSIGEKLLRLPHKGAIAVVASSWRNAPPLELGRKLIELLGSSGHPRVGDAFVAAKHEVGDRIALATYNLLGDPTTPYRGPAPRPVAAAGAPKGATDVQTPH